MGITFFIAPLLNATAREHDPESRIPNPESPIPDPETRIALGEGDTNEPRNPPRLAGTGANPKPETSKPNPEARLPKPESRNTKQRGGLQPRNPKPSVLISHNVIIKWFL